MKSRFTFSLLSAFVLIGGTALAANPQVQISGNRYHISVCPGPVRPGMARCHAHVVTNSAGVPYERAAGPLAATPDLAPPGYGPADLRSAYNITANGAASTIIAIVDAYGYAKAETDLGVYRSTYGLSACTTKNGCFTKYNQTGQKTAYPKGNKGWAQETALDLDMASAMCPNCKIILVEANSPSFADLGAAVNTAAILGAHVISNSYGGGEGGSNAYEVDYNHPGVAVTASTGDAGYGAQFPATSPHVTAVGGTHLVVSATARGWSETVWAGGGSGCSLTYAKPSWQTDASCAKRMEADVSAVADPATGVAVFAPSSGSTASSWQVYGGTSVAAPLVGGIYGLNGGAVTYGQNPYLNTGALNDVTSGSNGTCTGAYFCKARAGYDGPTGLGTPKGATAF